ncbi:MAG TPA: MFS transporter [Segeticoccus sp.]|nr:MFS transporter [Segeticoccus sp.]
MTPRRAGRREWAGLAVLTLPVLLLSVDSTVLGFAVPALSEALHPSSAQLLWIVDIYSFVIAGLLVTMGTLADRIGRRRLLMIGSSLFGLVSLAAAYAPNAEALIATRGLMGVAGATLMPSTMSLLRNLFHDPTQRRIAIASWGASFAAGGALGPILGGFLLEHFWWGSVFLINLPIMGLLLVLAPFLLPESRRATAGRYDLPSVALSLGAILPATYGVKELAEHGPDVTAVLGLVVGIAIGVLFVRRQGRIPDPMLDLHLFGNRAFSVALASNFLSVFAFVGALFFLTQYLQLVLDLSPIQAALRFLPGLALSVVGSFTAVALARRFRLGTVVCAGLLISAAGYAIGSVATTSSSSGLVVALFALVGTGAGLAETLTNDAVLTIAPVDRAGAASAASETAYELGAALGTALLGSLLTAVYRTQLTGVSGVPDEVLRHARRTLGEATTLAQSLPGQAGRALQEAANAAFASGVRVASIAAAVMVLYAGIQAAVSLRHLGAAAGDPSPGTPPPPATRTTRAK